MKADSKSNLKKCNFCGKTLTLDKFGKRKDSIDGLRHVCRSCLAIQMINWRKTGSTTRNTLEGKSLKELVSLRSRINIELKRRRKL